MHLEMSKSKRILALIAVMSTSVAVMADLVLIPVIKLLYMAFPNDMEAVNYIVSGDMLIIVLASLATGALLKKMNKKTLIVIGGIIFAIGSIAGVLIEDPLYMCIMRTLVGIGAGVTNVVAVALIADLYDDDQQRAKITGYYNAALSFVGVIFSFVAGIVAENSTWESVFSIYWVAVPMVILLILFIPSIKPGEAEKAEAKKASGEKEKLGWRFWWMQLCWFVVNVVMCSTFLYYLSSYVMENDLGGAAFAGTAASVKSIAGFLICLIFGIIYKKFGRKVMPGCLIIAALSMVLMVLFPSQVIAILFATIGGCAYKIAFSYAYAHGFSIVPASRIDESVSITTAVYGIGSFLSTYYATWLLQVMNVEVVTPTWMISAAIMVVFAVIEFIVMAKEKKEFGNE